jgi:predicted nucleic acid-binding Zn ribbon protein
MKLCDVSPQDLARAAWPAAVGKRIAAYCERMFLDGNTLTVEVEDGVWQTQLTTLAPQILNKLDDVLGPGVVNNVRFRVAIQRRPVERAARAHPSDEADLIADPVLRRVYKSARKKATA